MCAPPRYWLFVHGSGASDDGAGCAVLLEVLRALSSAPRPFPHDAVFLFNGAEENIMQASHAFVSAHRWARRLRVVLNLEACGSGGREVLFQAGPHDPWILEVGIGRRLAPASLFTDCTGVLCVVTDVRGARAAAVRVVRRAGDIPERRDSGRHRLSHLQGLRQALRSVVTFNVTS